MEPASGARPAGRATWRGGTPLPMPTTRAVVVSRPRSTNPPGRKAPDTTETDVPCPTSTRAATLIGAGRHRQRRCDLNRDTKCSQKVRSGETRRGQRGGAASPPGVDRRIEVMNEHGRSSWPDSGESRTGDGVGGRRLPMARRRLRLGAGQTAPSVWILGQDRAAAGTAAHRRRTRGSDACHQWRQLPRHGSVLPGVPWGNSSSGRYRVPRRWSVSASGHSCWRCHSQGPARCDPQHAEWRSGSTGSAAPPRPPPMW